MQTNNHVPTVYDKPAHQAFCILMNLDRELLESTGRSANAMRAAVEALGFVWSGTQYYRAAPTPVSSSTEKKPAQLALPGF